jgi:hypothetical protein
VASVIRVGRQSRFDANQLRPGEIDDRDIDRAKAAVEVDVQVKPADIEARDGEGVGAAAQRNVALPT